MTSLILQMSKFHVSYMHLWCECHTRASSRRGGGAWRTDAARGLPWRFVPAAPSWSHAVRRVGRSSRLYSFIWRGFWVSGPQRGLAECWHAAHCGGAWSSCRSGSRSQQRSPSGMWVCTSVFKSLRRGRLPYRPGSESQRRGSREGDPVWTALEVSTIKNTCLLLSFSSLWGLYSYTQLLHEISTNVGIYPRRWSRRTDGQVHLKKND